jgi:hypothetical protein
MLALPPYNSFAAEPPTITIVVPAVEVLPGDDVDLAVTGVLPADLTPGKIFFLPPENATARCRLTIQWAASGLEPVITFRAKSPGSYRVTLVKAMPTEKLLAATAIVTVGGPNPDPFPNPDPVPAPGKLDVLLLQETADVVSLPPAQRAILTSLTFRKFLQSKGHNFLGCKDKDARDSKGAVPAELAPFFSAAGGKTPSIVIRYANGIIKVFPLPADEAATTALLTKEES